MLTIRSEQMQVLATASFEAWLLRHAQRHFADMCMELGPTGTRDLIRQAVGRARWYGLDAGPDICQFVDLALTFGSDFDQREAWAAGILARAGRQASSLTVALLYDAAMDFLGAEVEDELPSAEVDEQSPDSSSGEELGAVPSPAEPDGVAGASSMEGPNP